MCVSIFSHHNSEIGKMCAGRPTKFKAAWKSDTGLDEATGFKKMGEEEEEGEPLFDLNKELAKIRMESGGGGGGGKGKSAGSGSAGVKPPSRKYGDVTVPSSGRAGKGGSASSERQYWFRLEGEEDMADPEEVPDPSTFFVAPKTKVNDPIDYGGDDDEMDGTRRVLRVDDTSSADDARRFQMEDFDKLTAADIALRQDRFINFLSLSCGFSALSVTDCFASRPPTSCRTYADYQRYMNAAPKTMLNVTNDIVSRASNGRLSLEACINLPDSHPLRTSVAELAGTKFRKIFLDNPIRSVMTRNASLRYLQDENRILKRVYTDIMRYTRYMIPRSGYLVSSDTVSWRELNWVGN